MDQNFLDKLGEITGKVPGDIQDLLGEMSLDDIYTLMNLVHNGEDDKVRSIVTPLLDKAGTDATDDNADTSNDTTDTNDTDTGTDTDSDQSNGDASDTSGVDAVPTQESVTLSFNFSDFGMREEALGLLEDNNIKYSFGLNNLVRVHCRSLAEGKLVQSITDSIATKTITETTMKKKDDNKIVVPSSKPRDTAYGQMIRAQQAGEIRATKGPNKKDRLQKADTKHKARAFEGHEPYVSFWTSSGAAFDVVLESFGNHVTFNGKALKTDTRTWTKIQESLSAEGFLSGKDFGKFDMKKKNVNEGVLGMTAMPGLRRMMELAGMPADNISQLAADPEVQDVPLLPDETAANDEFDADPLTSDHVVGGDDHAEDMGDEFGDDDMMGDDDVLGDDFGTPESNMGDDVMGGESVTSSPAFDLIDDALNSVQSNLPDVKISEYKTLIQRLEELQVQLQQIGKSYLGI